MQGSGPHDGIKYIYISLVDYKLAGQPNLAMDPQIFQYGVQRTPKFENLDTSLDFKFCQNPWTILAEGFVAFIKCIASICKYTRGPKQLLSIPHFTV